MPEPNEGQRALVGYLFLQFVSMLQLLSSVSEYPGEYEEEHTVFDAAECHMEMMRDSYNSYTWRQVAMAFKHPGKLKMVPGVHLSYVYEEDDGDLFVTCYDENVANVICEEFNFINESIRNSLDNPIPANLICHA